MAGSTTVTANKGRRRRTPARSRVRLGWRKRLVAMAKYEIERRRRMAEFVKGEQL